MPTQSVIISPRVNRDETSSILKAESLAVSAKQEWETPELKMISMEETESGFIYATKETTIPVPTRPLAS